MNSAPTPAAARLAEAKTELKRVERQIEVAAEHRRQCLLQGSAKSAAAIGADRELADLKLYRARLADQIELLPPLVMREKSEAAWPPTAALARKKLDEMKRRLGQLQSKKKLDRSAADDSEIDSLIPGCGAMARHAEFLEQFEANSQGRAVA
jgi:hypothetical protein